MPKKNECGCSEYQALSRRGFLQVCSAAAAAAIGPAWLPHVAYAADGGPAQDVIVSIFLRGAADGLSLCVPYFENAYYTARPQINVPRPDSGSANAAIDLDGFFGFPQGMASLVPAYDAGDLLVVHACGSKDETRSHFDAQHFMEIGQPRSVSLSTGWLGRHLITNTPMVPGSLIRAMGISGALQQTLIGSPGALPVPDPKNFGLGGNTTTAQERLMLLTDVYQSAEEPLKTAAAITESTVNLLDAIDFEGYTPQGDAVYSNSAFNQALKASAALINANAGVEAIAIDKGAWDTHVSQGTTAGALHNLMLDLSSGLSAFHADMIQGRSANVTVVVMTEFGRMLRQNGGGGTDHGHGGVMFAMGSHIAGGQVLSDWPGLEPEQLFQYQDLEVTIDYRDILAEILQNRLGNTDLGFVFPDHTPTTYGVTT